jgi:hypothetical protein
MVSTFWVPLEAPLSTLLEAVFGTPLDVALDIAGNELDKSVIWIDRVRDLYTDK